MRMRLGWGEDVVEDKDKEEYDSEMESYGFKYQ